MCRPSEIVAAMVEVEFSDENTHLVLPLRRFRDGLVSAHSLLAGMPGTKFVPSQYPTRYSL